MAWSAPSAVGTKVAADNAPVTPGTPGAPAGATIFALAGSRLNTGITWTASAGWTEIVDVSGIALYAKIAAGSDTMPTLTPAGGIGGNTMMAFAWYHTGGQANLATMLAHNANMTNPSATSISTPACTISTNNTLVLWLGACGDNQSGVTTNPTGSTALGDTASTLGQDGSLVAAYAIQSTAANVSASAFALLVSSTTGAGIVIALKAAGTFALSGLGNASAVGSVGVSLPAPGSLFTSLERGHRGMFRGVH